MRLKVHEIRSESRGVDDMSVAGTQVESQRENEKQRKMAKKGVLWGGLILNGTTLESVPSLHHASLQEDVENIRTT